MLSSNPTITNLRRAWALLLTICAACSADRPDNKLMDAAIQSTTLAPPMIDGATPLTTPNGTVAIRGTTDGSRVVATTGTGQPVVVAALPTGGFCLDVPLNATGATDLSIYALKDGLISPVKMITVTKDSGAPIPSMAQCSGMEAPVCVAEDTAHNDCKNGKDDDCNGYIDACDTNCNGCVEDAVGPNWVPFFVPMLAAGTYKLEICPCRSDWFAFNVAVGDTIHAKATFVDATIDLDMRLQTPANAEANNTTSVASSISITNMEEINYSVTAAGTYYLNVFPFKTDATGPYTLVIY